MNDFLRASCKFYRNLGEHEIRVVLAHPGGVILPELDARLGTYAQSKMAEAGVEVRLETKVNGYVDDEVQLSDASSIRAKTLLWTAGVSPSPLVQSLPCRKERGGIAVDEYLEVPEWPGVWALGDCAMIPTRTSGQFYPPTAQHAQAESKILAENIKAAIRGGDKKPFVFRELGKMAVIGRRSGVANVLGVDISGPIAWGMWRFLNRSLMPGTERKLRITLDWGLDLLFPKDLVQVGIATAPTISTEPGRQASPVSDMTAKAAPIADRILITRRRARWYRPRRERANSRTAYRRARPQAAQLRGPEAPGLDQQGLEGNTPTILEFDRMPVVRHPSLAVYHDDRPYRAASSPS